MVAEMILVVSTEQALPAAGEVAGNNIEALGLLLYTAYVYPLEIAAMILLVAIIAAILLTHRRRVGTKLQNPAAQVKVRSSDRLRIIRDPAPTAAEKTES
jgi:NADH-quinone oxidoreductase subunit J